MAPKINLSNLANILVQLTPFIPALITATGIPESPIAAAIVAALPEIEKDAQSLLAAFQQHLTPATSSTPITPAAS